MVDASVAWLRALYRDTMHRQLCTITCLWIAVVVLEGSGRKRCPLSMSTITPEALVADLAVFVDDAEFQDK